MTLQHSPTTDSALLAPSQALNRFQLPTELVVGDTTFTFERIRYGFPLSSASGFGLLIDSDTPSEVIDPQTIFPLPNTPAALLGLINLRGNLIPVFDFQSLLNIAPEQDNQTTRRILILGSSERTVGILIDSLPEVPDLSHKLNRLPPLPANLTEHVSAAYSSDGFIWLDFQHHSFFRTLATQLSM